MSVIWPFAPNWREPYSVSYEFRTDIFTSRSGKEQRRAARTNPRKQVKFIVTRTAEQAREFSRFMVKYQGPPVTMADLSRHAPLRLDAATNATVLRVNDSVQNWLTAGASVILARPGKDASYTRVLVQSVAGDAVTLTAPLAQAWPAGSKLHPPLDGKLLDTIPVKNYADRTIEAEINFAVDPGSAGAKDDSGDIADVFNYREVFAFGPNFAQPVQGDFKRSTDVVDFSTGRIATFLPVAFSTRTKQYQMMSPTRQQRGDLLALFLRMKGQRGEFYMPSFEDDFTLAAPAAASSLTVTFAGTDLHEVYQADDVHRALLIRLPTGERFFRAVTASATDGSTTTFTTDIGWPTRLDGRVKISWLVVHRFAVDQLNIDSVTDEVATMQFSVTSLEDRPVDDPDRIYTSADLDGAALWVIQNWGKQFFEQRIYDQLDVIVNYQYPYITRTIGLHGLDVAYDRFDAFVKRYASITYGAA